jgi:hypothetical protein
VIDATAGDFLRDQILDAYRQHEKALAEVDAAPSTRAEVANGF